jgi:hypothetical protein
MGGSIAGFAYYVWCPSGGAMEGRDPVVRAALNRIARVALIGYTLRRISGLERVDVPCAGQC